MAKRKKPVRRTGALRLEVQALTDLVNRQMREIHKDRTILFSFIRELREQLETLTAHVSPPPTPSERFAYIHQWDETYDYD